MLWWLVSWCTNIAVSLPQQQQKSKRVVGLGSKLLQASIRRRLGLSTVKHSTHSNNKIIRRTDSNVALDYLIYFMVHFSFYYTVWIWQQSQSNWISINYVPIMNDFQCYFGVCKLRAALFENAMPNCANRWISLSSAKSIIGAQSHFDFVLVRSVDMPWLYHCHIAKLIAVPLFIRLNGPNYR